MGNIGSQTGHINQLSEEQWNYSFPRAQATFYQQHHKVLPDRDARQRLRPTNNGEILQSGGTLTGRQNPSRITLPKEVQIKRCDSAPDLRFPQKVTLDHNKDAIRSKKKYKAPSPPKMRNQAAQWDTNRKPRLFKTRLETIKNNSSPINKPVESIKYSKNETNQLDTSKTDNMNYVNNKTLKTDDNLQQEQQKRYTNNTIDFKDELQMVTSNLKYNHVNNKVNNDDYKFNGKIDYKEKIKTLDHNIKKYKKPINDNVDNNTENKHKLKSHTEAMNNDGFDDNFDKIESDMKISDKKQEPKTFYFGMEETMNYTMDNNNMNYDVHLNNNNDNDASSFESDLSSWTENNNADPPNRSGDYQTSKSGIDLKLRPILPKKPLEIPRFSPAAAWRLLSTMNFSEQSANTLASDDCPVFVEDRIEKYSRPPPPTIQAARFSNDKSGDSGISGDAGPTVFEDGAEMTLPGKLDVMPAPLRHPHRSSWTPQQDLEDDSSMEEYLNNETGPYKANEMTTKPHVFSLSLPRDNHLASYLLEKSESTNTNGLKKLKRSVSGVLNNLARRDFTQPNLTQEQSDNWLLSKSAANSLTNGFNSLEMRYSQKSDDFKNLLATNKTQNGGRVMYLPEFDGNFRKNRSNIKDNMRYRSRSMERIKSSNQFTVYSKSCENITAELQSSSSHSEPEDLQDPTSFAEFSERTNHAFESTKKPKKFTFQSTIRQIERKIIAEKLSREAERKEKQRLREVEAMRKVEEEFQKKRAREKAAIRQQLRMYSGNEVPWSSLPPNIDTNKEQIPTRTEPDGATSSSPTTSSPMLPLKSGFTEKSNKVYQKNKRLQESSNIKQKSQNTNQQKIKTQVLSEYRQPQRDYKEYRSSTKYTNNKRNKYTTTVHPQVECDMPKFKKY